MLMPASHPMMAGRFELARRSIHRALASLSDGELHLQDGNEMFNFGTASDLSSSVVVHDHRLYQLLMLQGTNGAGDAYEQGWWSSNDLVSVIRLLVRNRSTLTTLDGGSATIRQYIDRWQHRLRRNTLTTSKENIEYHYDLGNSFYTAWLDPGMSYSGAIFRSGNESLEEAQIEKNDRLCRLLALSPQDHLLEIGCGWGGLAIHAAKNYGCKVTAITISPAQYTAARERVENAGLGHRVTILNQDYRNVSGQFSKIVSVEMIEAVGYEFLPLFVKRCQELLAPDGLLALQLISMNDQHFDLYRRSADFIQRRIFPGSCLISIAHLLQTMKEKTDFRFLDTADFTLDYARTLSIWRERFLSASEEIEALGFNESFRRRWEFYLAYCEGGFRERFIGSSQLLFGRAEFRGAVGR